MRITVRKASAIIGLLLPLVAFAAPANAQASRTWVSGVGDDVNPCSRTAPCKTFAGAISKTAAGGEISVLDPGGFGAVTITKSISITNDRTGEAGILATGTNGIIVNAPATAFVNIRGLVIDGNITGLVGINFIAGGSLNVTDCVIRNFQGGSAMGINFHPNSAAQLFVSDTLIANNGAGGAVSIIPAAGGSVNGVFTRTNLAGNNSGFFTNGANGAVHLTISDSRSAGSPNNGVTAASAGNAVVVMVDRSSIVNNTTFGLRANGAGAQIFVGNSIVSGNGTGVSAVSGGVINSYKNNGINGNTADGTPVPAAALN